MSQNNCGFLQFIKGDEGTPSAFNLISNETYTIGTLPRSNIRLKVHTLVPECSILKTNSQGFTEFLSNGVSNCLINNKPFKGAKYLVPGDIIDLLGRKLKYVNPGLTDEKIEVLQQENRKLFCKERIKEKTNRHTIFLQRNAGRTPILIKGFRTPGPKADSMYKERKSSFTVEDIKYQPITPSRNSEGSSLHSNCFKNLFGSPQYTKSSNDNSLSFIQFHDINVNFEKSSSYRNSHKRKERYSMNKMVNEAPDTVSIQNSPFDKHITNAAEDVTLINDVSAPFSLTPESVKEFISNSSSSLKHKSSTTPVNPSTESETHIQSILKDNVNKGDSKQTGKTPKSILKDNVNKGDSKQTGKTPKSILKKQPQKASDIAKTPNKSVNKENRRRTVGGRTPKTGARCRNDAGAIMETSYAEVNTRSASMTPDLRKLRSSSFCDHLSKTPSNATKFVNGSTSGVHQSADSVATMSKSEINKSPYVKSVEDFEVLSSVPSPKRYSQRVMEAKGLFQTEPIERKHSEIIEERAQGNEIPLSTPDLRSSRHSASSVSDPKYSGSSITMINDDFVTRRSSRKPSSVKRIETLRNEEVDVAINEEHSDGEYSSGSSSGHYDSDRGASPKVENSNLSGIKGLEVSVLDSSLKDIPLQQIEETNNCTLKKDEVCYSSSDQENITLDENKSSVYSLGISPYHSHDNSGRSQSSVDSSVKDRSVKRSRKLTNSTPNVPRKRRKRAMSGNELTSIEDIKDLLDIGHTTPRLSFNEIPDYEDIKDLLDASSQAKKPSKATPKNDLRDVRDVKQHFTVPKVEKSPGGNLEYVSDIKRLSRTPKVLKSPENDLSNVKGAKNLMKKPRAQNPPKNDLNDVRDVKRLLKTPKTQNEPKNDLTNVKGVRKLLATPKPQKTPKNDLRDVRGVKSLLKTPKPQKQPKDDLTDVKGVKQIMATPKPQKPPKNNLDDVRGVKELLKTPKVQKEPKNDLTEVRGLKKLMATPKVQKSPKNDLDNVKGLRKLMATPKLQKPPKNELSNVKGVKKLMATPKPQKSPKNDLGDVGGVKKLFTIPKEQNSPKDDLTDVRGVKDLFKILEDNCNRHEVTYDGLKELFKDDDSENDSRDPFDKLINQKSFRTYGGKSISPQNKSVNIQRTEVQPSVLKWVEEQRKHVGSSETFLSEMSPPPSQTNEDTVIEKVKQPPVRQTRRRKLPSVATNGEQETSQLNTRGGRTRKKKVDDPKIEDAVSIGRVNTRQKSKSDKIEEHSENNDENPTNVKTKIAKGKNKKEPEESSVDEMDSKPRRGRRNRFAKKKMEEIKTPTPEEHTSTSTPITRGRTRRTTQMKNDNKDVSDETEEDTKIQNKRPTRKAAQKTKSLRQKKELYVDESTTNTTLTEDDKIKPVEEERDVTPPPKTRGRKAKKPTEVDVKSNVSTRRGRSRKIKPDENDISLTKLMVNGSARKKLYHPELHAEVEATALPDDDDHTEVQNAKQATRKKSKRNIYLPIMLEEFEHNLSGSIKNTNTKAPSKRTATKRKAATELASDHQSVTRVTRSKRTRT